MTITYIIVHVPIFIVHILQHPENAYEESYNYNQDQVYTALYIHIEILNSSKFSNLSVTPCSPCIIENKFHRDYAFNNSAITFQRYMDIAAKAAAYAAYNQPSYNYSSYSGQDESYSSGYGSVSGQEYDDSYSYSSTDYSYKGHTIEAPPTQYSTAPPTNSGYEQLHPPGTSTMERPPYPVCTQY